MYILTYISLERYFGVNIWGLRGQCAAALSSMLLRLLLLLNARSLRKYLPHIPTYG